MYWITSSVALFFSWKYIELASSSIVFSKLLPIVFVFILLSMAFRIYSALNAFMSPSATAHNNGAARHNSAGGFWSGGGDGGSGSCGGDGGG